MISTPVMALETPISQPENLSAEPCLECLTRSKKEAYAIAVQERDICHLELQTIAAPPQTNWGMITVAILGGIVGGMLINQNVKK